MPGMRIDKWLWAARFFKTRALAQRACELGRVQLGEQNVKPARELHAGDRLRVTTEGGTFDIEIVALSEVRGPAAVARTLYSESDASRAARQQAAAERKAQGPGPDFGSSRPSKRDRRRIIQFRQDRG